MTTTYEVRTAGHEYDEDGYTIGSGDGPIAAIADAEDVKTRFSCWLVEIRDHVTDLPGVQISWPLERTVAYEHAGVWDLTDLLDA